MEVLEVLTEDRVRVSSEDGRAVVDKDGALRRVAELLSVPGMSHEEIEARLRERESMQSTGVGEGVAVPHAVVAGLERPVAAMLLCPEPVPFEAVDGAPVHVFIALVSPGGAHGNHLRLLARLSRVLRSRALRDRLLQAPTGRDAYAMLREEVRGAA